MRRKAGPAFFAALLASSALLGASAGDDDHTSLPSMGKPAMGTGGGGHDPTDDGLGICIPGNPNCGQKPGPEQPKPMPLPTLPPPGKPPATLPPSANPIDDELRLPVQPRPYDWSWFRRVADAYRRDGDSEAADRVLDRFLGANPKETWALVLRGQTKMDLKDYAGARALAQQALAVDPSDQAARDLAGMAGAYLRGPIKLDKSLSKPSFNRPEESPQQPGRAPLEAPADSASPQAESALPGPETGPGRHVAIISGHPPSAGPSQSIVGEAYAKAQVNDLAGALLDLSRAIDDNPRNQNAWALRAYVDNRMGNHDAAKRDADQALTLDPGNVPALRARAFAQYKLGNYQSALADADQAVRLEPGNALGHLYRGMILEKLGRVTEAIQEYRDAARLDPALRGLMDDALRRLGAAPPETAPQGRAGSSLGRLPRALLIVLAAALLLLGLRGAVRRAGGLATTRPPVLESPLPVAERSAVLSPGTMLAGNYLVSRMLGRGGMGIVYGAEDRALERPVAIKQLSTPDRSPEYIERFLREARLVAKLKHPNLVQIYSVVEEEGERYLIFEYVEGRTLDEMLLERIRLPPAETRGILRDLCAALEYAHKERIIHRDIKPSNVMMAKDGSCRVMDFGIAHQARTVSKMTQTNPWGTPLYMAPEQEMGNVAPESDLYALGVMAYEMLTGRRPFDGDNCLARKLKGSYAPATAINPELTKRLDPFFARVLSPEPESRPRTARQFFEEFEGALGEPTPV